MIECFPDPASWIELPGTRARLHRDNVRPCGECGANFFNVVVVRRADRKPDEDGRPVWSEWVSVECPRCRLVSVKSGDRRTVIAQLDATKGQIVNIQRGHEGHGTSETGG